MSDITWANKSTGDQVTAADMNEIKSAVNSKPDDSELTAGLAGKADTAHNHNASSITSGTLDGDRLPALSTTKKGGVPATGAVPSATKFLNETGAWTTPAGGGSLPDPTGEDGKFLTNDGASAAWAELPRKVFNVVDYGADPNNTADDTAAIQAAIDACFAAGGGVVYFPLPRNASGYHYTISGALVTSVDGINPNCQLYIPLHTNDGHTPTIVFEGEVPPSFNTEGISSVARNNIGAILESTIIGTGSRPSVFGTSYYASGSWGDRNFVKVVMRNLIVRTRTMTGATDIAGTMTAINFAKLTSFQPDEVKCDITSALSNSIDPASTGTYGFIFPDVNNKVELKTGNICAEGYDFGICPGEHFNAQMVQAYGCNHGIYVTDGPHAMDIQHYTAEVCRNNITLNGTGNLAILQYETEHYAGGEWYAQDYDILRQAGATTVRIFNSNVVISGVGRVTDNSNFLTSGTPDYKVVFGCGENALSGSGGAGELAEYSDSELLSLAWTTPHTYYNTDAAEMQYFDGTDYFSLDKTPYTPAASTLLADDFNRADSTVSLGNTVTPGTAWPAPASGTWGIATNNAYCVSETGSGATTFYMQQFDVSASDFTLECVIRREATLAVGGFIFRFLDASNTLYLEVSDVNMTLYKRVLGTFTSIGAASVTNTISVPMTVKITCAGNAIEVFKNGTSVISVTDATHNTETVVGMVAVGGTGFGGGVFFDDLSVTG